MSADTAVLVPVLGRPHRVLPVMEGFAATTPGARLLFIADPDDAEEIEALESEGADYIAPGGNYARKIRAGIEATAGALVFTGADDLDPRPGWLEAARSKLVAGIEVVGINDLIPRPHRPEHATHFLMTRAYAEQPTISGTPGPFFDGYVHWNVDDELIATATHRGVYAYSAESRMLHLHPMVGRSTDDATYQRGRAQRRRDQKLFRKRAHLWR